MPIPEKNFYYLLVPGFIFSLLTLFYKDMSAYQYSLYSLLIILVTIDLLFLPGKKMLRIKRIYDKFFSIGVNNPIKIEIINNSKLSYKAIIRDEYPLDFIIENETIKTILNALSYNYVVYHVKPFKKGNYSFTHIHIRIIGKLGLIAWQYKFKYKDEVRVYPNLLEIKKYFRFSRESRLQQIGYKKREHGGETEFDFLREYQYRDDYKRINWKASAKKNFPVINIFQKEYNRNILVFLDAGRMMTTVYKNMTKLDYSIDTALILAAVSNQHKDYFGLLTCSSRIISFIRPTLETNKVLTKILSALYNIHPAFDKTDYFQAYAQIKNKVRKNSMIFIFSELYNKTISQDLITFIKLLSKNHRVFMVSFEEVEEMTRGQSFKEITRWILQHDQLLEKELIIRDLKKHGINIIRVNAENIKQQVVNSYLLA